MGGAASGGHHLVGEGYHVGRDVFCPGCCTIKRSICGLHGMRVKLILICAIVVATVGGTFVSSRDSIRTLVIEACSGLKNAAACADSPPLIRAIDLLAPDGRTCDPSRQIFPPVGTLPADVPRAVANTLAVPNPPATRRRLNIVFVLADDFSFDLIPCMPHVLQMMKDGASFANYFVTDSLCCPSRASIFTGRLPHNTGIYTNTEPNGGFIEFLKRGHEEATFARPPWRLLATAPRCSGNISITMSREMFMCPTGGTNGTLPATVTEGSTTNSSRTIGWSTTRTAQSTT
jgi:hypothetical protein